MNRSPAVSPTPSWPLILFPALKLAVHLATLRGFGIFRDELYYVVCSERLAWGYVDHPPFSLAVLRIWREAFGGSLVAMRLLPALLGAATVWLVGRIALRMGGGVLAQSLAMAAALAAPVFLSVHHVVSMNAWTGIVWALAGLLLVEIARGGPPRLWLALGAVLGVGLLNKIDVLWLGFGLGVGLLASAERRWLGTRWPWIAAGLAFAIFSPHLVWQAVHGWPTLEFVENATGLKMSPVSPAGFLLRQVETIGPAAALVSLAGLAWLFGAPAGRPFRLLGWAWLAVLGILLVAGSSRASYLAPAFTWLFAAGGVAVEGVAGRWRRPALGWLVPAPVLLLGAATAPFALPVLPVDATVRYAAAAGVEPSTEERKELGRLPQFYADMHGWESIVGGVEEAVGRLSAAEREAAVVFGPNYGVASAVEVLGRDRGLPPAVSGHNNYWLWGPRGASGEVVVVVGGERDELEERFASVERGATTDCGDCMPYEDGQPVWIARGLRRPLAEVWPQLKHYD